MRWGEGKGKGERKKVGKEVVITPSSQHCQDSQSTDPFLLEKPA